MASYTGLAVKKLEAIRTDSSVWYCEGLPLTVIILLPPSLSESKWH